MYTIKSYPTESNDFVLMIETSKNKPTLVNNGYNDFMGQEPVTIDLDLDKIPNQNDVIGFTAYTLKCGRRVNIGGDVTIKYNDGTINFYSSYTDGSLKFS